MKKVLFLILLPLLLWNCKTSQPAVSSDVEFRQLDTMYISAPKINQSPEKYTLPKYNASATRELDLIHTKLDLRFDWTKEQVIGKATLTLKPYFYATDKVILDAKGFEFHYISLEGQKNPLKYDYDGQKVTIQLDRLYKRDEAIQLFIDYTATPRGDGGSAAISSDKGLYFINPRGEDPNKPQQIWTQGETESNSRWFPTIDKPNERCTQEMYLTVEDRFKTLSNGLLISSTPNKDGTRTDYYKMDLPHAPYLFMIAIGEYAVVKDNWENVPLEYYVEPAFEKDAKAIFPHTPEMLGFFSDILGVRYPWPKYSQVVVRDYVSGAMENTTGVIFGEFVQRSSEELADNDDMNEQIVAHEMFHHWFGDYVTCESWSNLTLNEGFANYSEYLWMEYKHGKDEADSHLRGELKGYLASAQNGGIHDLIDFGYDSREQMFDAHSYNKGGLVLNMLRDYVGDEAFFASLQRYLSKNAFSDVEAHELRLAFEDVTGEDLNWFFNQWFFDQGHPNLIIDQRYDAKDGMVHVTVEQIQDPEKMPAIFQLPVEIDIYLGPDKVKKEMVRVTERKQTFSFPVDSRPFLVNFDARKSLLTEKQENKTREEYIFQYAHAPRYLDRFEALDFLQFQSGPEIEQVFESALSDPYWGLQLKAITKLNPASSPGIQAKFKDLAVNSMVPQVRAAALEALGQVEDPGVVSLIKTAMSTEKSLLVKGSALKALQSLDPKSALEIAKDLENENGTEIVQAIGEIYVNAGDPANLPYFEKKWDQLGGFAVISFVDHYASLASQADLKTIMETAGKLHSIGLDAQKAGWLRFGATKGLNTLHEEVGTRALKSEEKSDADAYQEKDIELVNLIEDIKQQEKSMQLKMFYRNFPTKIARP